MYRKGLIDRKKNLTDNLNLSGSPDLDSKYTINQIFNFYDPLDNKQLSKTELENNFLPATEKITLELLQKYQNLNSVIGHFKLWHIYKTKPTEADAAILGNKMFLRYFRNFYITTITENTDILEYQTSELEVLCLPLSMVLLALHISDSLNTKDMQDQSKHISILFRLFNFQMH